MDCDLIYFCAARNKLPKPLKEENIHITAIYMYTNISNQLDRLTFNWKVNSTLISTDADVLNLHTSFFHFVNLFWIYFLFTNLLWFFFLFTIYFFLFTNFYFIFAIIIFLLMFIGENGAARPAPEILKKKLQLHC